MRTLVALLFNSNLKVLEPLQLFKRFWHPFRVALRVRLEMVERCLSLMPSPVYLSSTVRVGSQKRDRKLTVTLLVEVFWHREISRCLILVLRRWRLELESR